MMEVSRASAAPRASALTPTSMFVAGVPLHGERRADNSDGSEPAAVVSCLTSRLAVVGVIPRKHTHIHCLQLELAALTFLWEMKISGGADQLILDSVFN